MSDINNKGDYRYRSDGTKFQTKAPLYEIEQKQLNSINTMQDIIDKIK